MYLEMNCINDTEDFFGVMMATILSIFRETRLCPARRKHITGNVTGRARCYG